MRLSDALKVAEKVVNFIQPHYEKVQVTGSIRRKKEEVKDVDIVCIPKPFHEYAIISELAKRGKVEVKGSKMVRATIGGDQVDVYFANEKNFGTVLLIRTGPMESNIRLSKRARKMGMKLSHDGLVKDGKIIASRTEEEIFKGLGLGYVSPEER